MEVSYEVGGDVFSLQELEHCVLRGRLPRPNVKDLPKRFAPLPPEGDDHYFYSLKKVTYRSRTVQDRYWKQDVCYDRGFLIIWFITSFWR